MEKKGNTGEKNKVNKHTSRYNFLPLLRFRPGGLKGAGPMPPTEGKAT